MRQLRLDMTALIEAMTIPDDVPFTSCLDLQEGTVVESGWQNMDQDEDEEDTGPTLDPDRYAEIPRLESRDTYAIMAAFAASRDDDLRETLDDALQGKGAFSRFRRVIDRDRALRDAWYAFQEDELVRIARDWLAGLEIEPIFELRHRTNPAATTPAAAPTPKLGLLELVLLGAPEGKTELLEGQVLRQIHAATPGEARAIFERVARDLCRYFDVPWRKHLVEGTARFDLAVAHLTVAARVVSLSIDVSIAVWKRFG